MTQYMVLNKKYIKITVLLLLLLMAVGNSMAQVVVGGSVFGGGNLADVKGNTEVNIGGGKVEGNVYGGGNLADVGTIDKTDQTDYNYTWTGNSPAVSSTSTPAVIVSGLCAVTITDGTIGPDDDEDGNSTADVDHGNVFGAGKGIENTFWCEKAMVYKATVSISGGTVKRNVYGGGRIGRVEYDTEVTIGSGTSDGAGTGGGTSAPTIGGSVFGAGAGVKTHGYSALVRNNSKVIVQGDAKVVHSVYGGGELATVGRYRVASAADVEDEDFHAAHPNIKAGMPYETVSGGDCTVEVKGHAKIGPDASGNVFGAGMGYDPTKDTYTYVDKDKPWRYTLNPSTVLPGFIYEETDDDRVVKEYFKDKDAFYDFLQTLALATDTYVTIKGNSSVKGCVYGGSQSGFVQEDTDVNIQGTCNIYTTGTDTDGKAIDGNVFGGGKGLLAFSEAGRVKGNTIVTISGGTTHGTVYGGGELGDVGTINKADIRNYTWKANTGKCEVEITGTSAVIKGNVFGAGKGEPDTFWCEKAMADNTSVSITNGTVWLNVYGGGEKGRVEQDTEVTIGPATGTCTLDIKGSVFGAGKGVVTHGYSALVRGNTRVTVQSNAVVEKSVYGGGEIASVGKYGLDAKGMPSELKGGGDCVVTVLGAVQIGTNGGGNVFGAGKGETPAWVYNSGDKSGCSKRMMTYNSSYKDADETKKWDYSDATKKYVWEYFPSSTQYSTYLETLALATNPTVTINGTIDGTGATYTVNGSVYGGGEVGITKGAVVVNIKGGTIAKDVYGGGALADTNTGNWSPNKNFVLATVQTGESVTGYFTKGDTYTLISDEAAVAQDGIDYYSYNSSSDNYDKVTGLTVGTSSVTGYYTKSDVYTQITDDDKVAEAGTDYYQTEGGWTDASGTAWKRTSVNLLGGYIKGDAYGGGLGQKIGFKDAQGNIATKDIEAVAWGDIIVTLNGTKFDITTYTGDYAGVVKSGRVFGCNNLNGSPRGNVTVEVYKTVPGNVTRTNIVRNVNYEIVSQGAVYTKVDSEDIEVGTTDVSNYYTRSGEEGNYTYTKASGTAAAETDYYEMTEVHTYEVAAVYGGGNLASYTTTGKKANVVIETCDVSIESVYGGGNAAAVPETDVLVKGAHEIGEVFGGGNGNDPYTTDNGTTWVENAGANVNGNANTLLTGGYVHEAYGGSNNRGAITGNVTIDVGTGGACTLELGKLVGAGKNADIDGNIKIIMGCKPEEKIPLIFGGADNANVNGNVELTVTSGNFGTVVGGNNAGGAIRGHIILNIEETTCIPLKIDNLYLCGYNAAYSQYGYYVKTTKEGGTPIGATDETADLKDNKLQLIPRESATDSHLPVKSYSYNESGVASWEVYTGEGDDIFTPYSSPVLNVTSCTSIGEVFGGGYGTTATVYGNPVVNINMIPGNHADEIDRDGDGSADGDNTLLGEIGDVYGGGDAAAVYGNTTVNIGTAQTVDVYQFAQENGEYKLQYEEDGVTPMVLNQDVSGAYITGNVYGGGKLADVGKYHEEADPVVKDRMNNVIDITGNTNVNICAKLNTTSGEWESVAMGTAGVIIGGSVYGGGKGTNTTNASDVDFYCAKAMVLGNKGTTESSNDTNNDGGGTHVRIGNGTINGNVYGGGEIARVERNTEVTIGFGTGVAGTPTTNKPVIMGTVYGAGAGLRTHGYSALVRGHSSVTIEGNAKVMQSVYGGGMLATVGRYQVTNGIAEYKISGGKCTVSIGGYAEIGPNDMVMNNTTTHKPDDYGHVFGAGKGTQPYEGFEDSEQPWSKIPNVYDGETGNLVTDRTTYKKFSDLVGNEKLPADYVKYLRTLALTTETEVTIKDNAFVKGCVFGGSENGFVQEDTHVTIQDDCQIGNGYVQMTDDGTYLATANMRGVNRRYTAAEWAAGRLFPESDPDYTTGTDTDLEEFVSNNNYYTSSLPECASWPYGQKTGDDKYAPYDKDALSTGYYDAGGTKTAAGGRPVGDDGHTFYGSVFGGGSGYYPYKPGRWFEDAGAVYGNARVDITGGHILTSVYGGNELTNVGKYQLDSDGKPTTTITSGGKCTITMSGGTVGVPRTLKQIGAHPVTCYLFGAGKGDQRVLFNKSTNVGDVEVNIKGGTIYGSVFGGGEDGHVMRDVKVTIGQQTTTGEGAQATTTVTGPTIGTWGTSYVDGNVFGGGRGFSGDAYTAGNVAGSIKMEIKGGNILGSIYGGGRLGSVGYGLFESTNTTNYGVMQDDNKDDEGETTTYYKDGAVGLGRGHIDITISGGTIGNDREYIIPNATNMAAADIPEGYRDISKWDDDNKYWTQWKEYHKIPKTEFDTTTGRLTHTKGGNVFAGGMGNFYRQDGETLINGVNWWQLGCVKSTTLTIKGGTIKSNVYGGGELGQVVGYHTTKNAANQNINASTEITIQGSSTTTIIGTEVKDGSDTQYTFGSVFGGGYGSLRETITVNGVTSYPKFIAGLVKEDTKVDMQNGAVKASVYGGGEMASVGESTTSEGTTTVKGSTYVSVSGGTVGIKPATISGSNRRYFGAGKMGNVYGGGSGTANIVRSGKIFKDTHVTISDGTIYHNIYGGGAYGSVGEFEYNYTTDAPGYVGISKVNGVKSCKSGGSAYVTITGGTIGYDGKENGIVFGSSRGDINKPGERDDHAAWVNDTHVIIGTAAKGTYGQEGYVAATGPNIKGTIYGSGENGHVFNNTVVTVNGGTIGINDSNDPGYKVTSNGTEYSGVAYPYRGNVYGGGCGTDMYYSGSIPDGHTAHDGEGDMYNPLAGIVYGTTTVNINDGTVVLRNVYGAGAMGSVGKMTTTEGVTTITDGGLTTINISGGIIGVDGNDNGNVFGAARGNATTTQTDVALVKTTGVTISGSADVKGSVYGGGETGDVQGNTTVAVQGGTIAKNVFGGGLGVEGNEAAGKVKGNTTLDIFGGTINGSVYGGGALSKVVGSTNVNIGEPAE